MTNGRTCKPRGGIRRFIYNTNMGGLGVAITGGTDL